MGWAKVSGGIIDTHGQQQTLDKRQRPIELLARLDVTDESESREELTTTQGVGQVEVGVKEL